MTSEAVRDALDGAQIWEPPVNEGQDQETRIWPAPLDLAKLAQQEPAQPEFTVEGWLPSGYATQIAAHGGVGKSSIAMHQGVCIAMERQWWGMRTKQSRVIYLSCEDRVNVLHWRLKHICDFMGVDMADLEGRLHLLDLVGSETILWRPERPYLTQAFHELQKIVRPDDVIYVDGVSDTFGGNENSRAEVKAFVNSLLSLIAPEQGAVVLIAHVNKATANNSATSEGYSGSTQWHNAVRARHYLYPETGDEQERTGRLILELQKSNLGQSGQQLTFRWDDAARLFVSDGGTAGHWLDRQEQDSHADAVFLKLLDKLNSEGRPVSDKARAGNYAPKAMSKRPDRDGLTRRQLDQAMERLFERKEIQVTTYKDTSRHLKEQIVRAK